MKLNTSQSTMTAVLNWIYSDIIQLHYVYSFMHMLLYSIIALLISYKEFSESFILFICTKIPPMINLYLHNYFKKFFDLFKLKNFKHKTYYITAQKKPDIKAQIILMEWKKNMMVVINILKALIKKMLKNFYRFFYTI